MFLRASERQTSGRTPSPGAQSLNGMKEMHPEGFVCLPMLGDATRGGVRGIVKQEGLHDEGSPESPRAFRPALPGASHTPASLSDPVRNGWLPIVLAGATYLALALLVWARVWTTHPTSVTTCGCGDAALVSWYFAWPAYALAHGLSPLHSTAMGYPQGVNLLSNASSLALGILLAPVTWLFGPIASLNVAQTSAPALTALAMFVLLRRWVSWSLAAFVGGLFYGFSPFLLAQLSESHLMVAMDLVPPLVLLCLDEILIRQKRRPLSVGVALGLLVALQFFLGTEALLILVMTVVGGVVAVVAYAALRDRRALVSRVRHATIGLGAGLATGGVLLAYPAWYALAGPSHLSGRVWPSGVHHSGTLLKDLILPNQEVVGPGISWGWNHVVGGYQGFILSPQYFGIGVIIVLGLGIVLWRRDRRLWLFGTIAVATAALSLGEQYDFPLPWRPIANLPLVQNILPGRFIFMTYLAVGTMLAIVVDRARLLVVRHSYGGRSMVERMWFGAVPGRALAVALAGAALLPPSLYLAQTVPFTTRAVVLPVWFSTVAPRLPGRQVVLAFPTLSSSRDAPMIWQAVNRMHYSMAEQGGPGGVFQRAGNEAAGQAVLAEAQVAAASDLVVTPTRIDQVRRALKGWKVTMIVVPDQPRLPVYERVISITTVAALVTAATGTPPRLQAHAWVWRGVDRAPASVHPSHAAFNHCIALAGLPPWGARAVRTATSCVLTTNVGPTGISATKSPTPS